MIQFHRGWEKQEMALRYVEYGNFPCMLVCYSQHGRKWYRKNRDVPSNLFPHNELDHGSAAFDVLFGGKSGAHRQVVSGGKWLSNWQANNHDVWEETTQLADGETLTLLTWKNEALLQELADE